MTFELFIYKLNIIIETDDLDLIIELMFYLNLSITE